METKIALIGTGGTIAGKGASNTDLTGYTAGVLGLDEILASVPDVYKRQNHTFRNACLLNIFCMAQKNRITMSDLILEEKTKIFDKHWCLHSIDSRYRCVNVSRFCNVLVVTSMDDFTKLANT